RPRFGKGLPVLGGDEAGQLFSMIFEEPLQLEKILNSFFRRRASPLWESSGSRLDGRRHIRISAKRRLGQRLAGRRVDHIRELLSGGLLPLTIYEIGHPAIRCPNHILLTPCLQ